MYRRGLQYLGVLAWLQKRIAKRFEVCGIEVARLARIVFIGIWRQEYGREDCEPVAGQRYGEQEDYQFAVAAAPVSWCGHVTGHRSDAAHADCLHTRLGFLFPLNSSSPVLCLMWRGHGMSLFA